MIINTAQDEAYYVVTVRTLISIGKCDNRVSPSWHLTKLLLDNERKLFDDLQIYLPLHVIIVVIAIGRCVQFSPWFRFLSMRVGLVRTFACFHRCRLRTSSMVSNNPSACYSNHCTLSVYRVYTYSKLSPFSISRVLDQGERVSASYVWVLPLILRWGVRRGVITLHLMPIAPSCQRST